MNSTGDRLRSLALALVFLVAAAAKIKHFLIEHDWALVEPVLGNPVVVGFVVLAELVIAWALIEPKFRLRGYWAAIAFVIVSNMATAYTRFVYGQGIRCGCLGRVPLTFMQHLLLSLGVFGLAATGIVRRRATRESATTPDGSIGSGP